MSEPVSAGDEYARQLQSGAIALVEPGRERDRGEGPYGRLVLRGATIIDGTGAPAWGPADLVIQQNVITEIAPVGAPGVPIGAAGRPAAGEREIDCTGKYVTPGFIDAHGHVGWPAHGRMGRQPPADYVYKLWLAHGVTTVREVGAMNGLTWTLGERDRAERGDIAAPRLRVHAYVPAVNDMLKTLYSVEDVREWVMKVAEKGANGLKFFGAPPALMRAALEAAKPLGLRTACHHAQQAVSRANALTTARWGLDSAEHFYGLPEALFEDRALQSYPADYNYLDEYMRFSHSGCGFALAAPPGSRHWNTVLDAFLDLDFTFVPTFGIYDANRDLMRARRADWHDSYTWPALWKSFQPNRVGHGSYWYRWSVADEVQWKEHFRLWMCFLNAYKDRGGRVAAGSDSGFIFQVYGFGFIRELEMLQESGFNALEVLRAATSKSAELLGLADEVGIIDVGYRADLLIHVHNPLADFKLLYGTGALRLSEGAMSPSWQRALATTIANGIVYDTEQLLHDVREMVAAEKAESR